MPATQTATTRVRWGWPGTATEHLHPGGTVSISVTVLLSPGSDPCPRSSAVSSCGPGISASLLLTWWSLSLAVVSSAFLSPPPSSLLPFLPFPPSLLPSASFPLKLSIFCSFLLLLQDFAGLICGSWPPTVRGCADIFWVLLSEAVATCLGPFHGHISLSLPATGL